MSTTIRTLGGLLLVAMTGCTTFSRDAYMDPKVAAQVTVSRSDPPPGCEYVGSVKGKTYVGELSDAHGDVLRNAVLRGGNFVTVDLVERPMLVGIGGYVVRGRLFTCPSAKAPVAVAPRTPTLGTMEQAATVKACEPDCAAGFSCQLGACVAAPAAQAAAPAN
jgi:hypothetical protein